LASVSEETELTDVPTAVMARLAHTFQGEHSSVEDTLQAVVAAAVDVPGAGGAGVTISARRHKPEVRAASDELVRTIEALQSEVGQGPSLEAGRERRTVRVDDVAADPRWPCFAASAAAEGVGSMLSFPLFVHARHLGVLTLYSQSRAAFTPRSKDIGSVFAGHAAVAIASAQQEAGLRLAVDHRDLIGQAKGILMERHKLTADQAFRLLVRASQNTNVRLYDVALGLTTTGEFPAV
jgi:GAF domain-containing protein